MTNVSIVSAHKYALRCAGALVLGLGLVGLSACRTAHHEAGPEDVTGVLPDGTPKWVHRGSGTWTKEGKKTFYGVGAVQGIQNEALARQTADNRARAEIAKIFDLYVAAMMRDYQRSTTAGDFSTSAEEQDVVSAQKTLTEVSLKGVEIHDHFRDPQTQTLFALAVLEVERMKDALKDASGLSKSMRDHVRRNADKAFRELDRDLKRRSGESDTAEVQDMPVDRAPALPPAESEAADPMQQDEEPEDAPSSANEEPKKLRVGLRVSGIDADGVQTCMAARILKAGYELIERSTDVDVMVKARLRYRYAGHQDGETLVQASLNVRVTDLNSGALVVAMLEKVKTGRRSANQALLTASTRLCEMTVPRIVRQIRAKLNPDQQSVS